MSRPLSQSHLVGSHSSDLTTGKLNLALFDPSVFPHDLDLREKIMSWFRVDASARVIVSSFMNKLLAEHQDASLGALLRRVFFSMVRTEGADFPPVMSLEAFLLREGLLDTDEGETAKIKASERAPPPPPSPSSKQRALSEANAAFQKASAILTDKPDSGTKR